jgi:pimeloyl-ACP methyl ester carboxylesterase
MRLDKTGISSFRRFIIRGMAVALILIGGVTYGPMGNIAAAEYDFLNFLSRQPAEYMNVFRQAVQQFGLTRVILDFEASGNGENNQTLFFVDYQQKYGGPHGNGTQTSIEDYIIDPIVNNPEHLERNRKVFETLEATPVKVPSGQALLNVWYVRPQTEKPTVLILMGNDNNWRRVEQTLETLKKAGLGIAAIELQGIGESSGKRNLAQGPHNVLDVSNALQEGWGAFLETPRHQQSLLGYSLGSVIITLAAAKQTGFRTLHLVAPLWDPIEALDHMKQHADPPYHALDLHKAKTVIQAAGLNITKALRALRKSATPVWIFSARQDRTTPPDTGERILSLLPDTARQIVFDSTHTGIWDPDKRTNDLNLAEHLTHSL